ncbi:hypothetical protein [Paraburkholderia sp. J63]|uniref:hypothetical protein n=1 Tax=Paraburkholderia sp. J63 TaxID=2805434 RepID=UPI002ABD2122|nr:hypothetical protein [Paraburkholderia sp. J63]
MSERFDGQAIAAQVTTVFDFFEKAFALVRDGCSKSDAHKLWPAYQCGAGFAALNDQASRRDAGGATFAERLCIEGSI